MNFLKEKLIRQHLVMVQTLHYLIIKFESGGFRLNNGLRVFGRTNTIFRIINNCSNFNNLNSLSEITVVYWKHKIITKQGEINVEDVKKDDIIKVYNFLTETWEWAQ